jgi:phosphohistidine phosphatase
MKRLALLRHAKSSWEQPDTDDFDRPLNERGWKAARRMGRELKHRKMRFDLCVASPAARARETLDGLAEGYGEFPFAVRFDERIYMASVATLLDLIRTIPDDSKSPLVVGHNPGLERMIVEVAKDDELRRRVEQKYPTAALAVVELPAKRWADIEPGSGEIAELILPKDLD